MLQTTAVFLMAPQKQLLRTPRMEAAGRGTFLGVDIPPLPNGRQLHILEGLVAVQEEETNEEDLADLLSVGGTVWPCAAALCRWLASHQELVQSSNVLELGGGTGVCGIFAVGLGANHVQLTDGSNALLKLQAANLKRNAAILPENPSASVQRLLWDRDAVPEPPSTDDGWQLIIGGDCTYMYDPEAHDALAKTIASILLSTASTGTEEWTPRVILSHEHRNRAFPTSGEMRWDHHDETLRRFSEACAEQSLELGQLTLEQQHSPGGGYKEVSVIEVKRCATSDEQ